MGAGEQIEVKELFGRAQGFDVRVGPERHADGAVGSHAHTSTDSLLPDSNHHTRRHWNGKGNSWSACAAASSPERMSLKTRRDNGTRPAHLPERDRKTVADMGTSFSWGLNDAHKKRQGDAPLLNEQPGPRGHPDVALPIHNRIPQRGCTGGKNKKTALSASLGLATGDGYASFSWEGQSRRRGA